MALWLVSSSGVDDGALRREAPDDDRGEAGDDDAAADREGGADDAAADREEGADDAAAGREEGADDAAPEEDATVSRRRALIGNSFRLQ